MGLADRIRGREPPPPPEWRRRPEILLCANIPKPMHGVAPRVVLGKAWWDKTRKAAYASTDYHCIACGVTKAEARSRRWLEAHELYETDYVRGRLKYIEAVPVCHFCHGYVHCGRLKSLLDQGLVHHAKYAAIIQHGDRVLAEAGLVKPPPYSGPICELSKWRLVIGRRQYKPLFKDYNE